MNTTTRVSSVLRETVFDWMAWTGSDHLVSARSAGPAGASGDER
ncbi:hypothetical protein AB0M58_14125 [Streptomyces bobili]